jgi:photosystem II reaction center protein PsbM
MSKFSMMVVMMALASVEGRRFQHNTQLEDDTKFNVLQGAFNLAPGVTTGRGHPADHATTMAIEKAEENADRLKKGALDLTRRASGPDAEKMFEDLNKFAVSLGEKGREGLAELQNLDFNERKRQVIAAATGLAMAFSPQGAFAAENVGSYNVMQTTFPAYLAVILGLSVPCVFLITLFIQSEAQGTATTFRQPDRVESGELFLGSRYEDE